MLLSCKVQLALAEQRGKAHILLQGVALALLDQAGSLFQVETKSSRQETQGRTVPLQMFRLGFMNCPVWMSIIYGVS